MIWPLLLFSTTTILFVLPVTGALLEWRQAGTVAPLEIIQAHAGDIRHFADSFRIRIEAEITEGRHKEDREHCLIAANEQLVLSESETKNRTVRRVVIAAGPLTLPDGYSYEREVYGRGPVVTGVDNRLCAVLAEGELHLKSRSVISRWGHAHSVRVDANCVIQGRLSAMSSISVASGCRFTRLNAPVVNFAPASTAREQTSRRVASPRPPPGKNAQVISDLVENRWVVDDDLVLPDEMVYRGDLVVHRDLVLGYGVKIMGRVKVSGNAQVSPNARIDGSIVCRGSLAIAEDCHILGPVVSEHGIMVGAGTTIGEPKRLSTVTAPLIHLASDVVVHGSVWARRWATVG